MRGLDPLVAAVLARFPGAEIVDVQIRADETAPTCLCRTMPAVENPTKRRNPAKTDFHPRST